MIYRSLLLILRRSSRFAPRLGRFLDTPLRDMNNVGADDQNSFQKLAVVVSEYNEMSVTSPISITRSRARPSVTDVMTSSWTLFARRRRCTGINAFRRRIWMIPSAFLMDIRIYAESFSPLASEWGIHHSQSPAVLRIGNP